MTKPLNGFWTVWQTVLNRDWRGNRDRTSPVSNGNAALSVPVHPVFYSGVSLPLDPYELWYQLQLLGHPLLYPWTGFSMHFPVPKMHNPLLFVVPMVVQLNEKTKHLVALPSIRAWTVMPINCSNEHHQRPIINFILYSWFSMVLCSSELRTELTLCCCLAAATRCADTFPIEFWRNSAWVSRQCLSDCSIAVVLNAVLSSVGFTTVSNACTTMRLYLGHCWDALSWA